jgi:hypothetical protein
MIVDSVCSIHVHDTVTQGIDGKNKGKPDAPILPTYTTKNVVLSDGTYATQVCISALMIIICMLYIVCRQIATTHLHCAFAADHVRQLCHCDHIIKLLSVKNDCVDYINLLSIAY